MVALLATLVILAKGACDADTSCNANRVCTFGSLETYDYVRRTLFDATGYPASCINLCNCPIKNPINPVQRMLSNAQQHPSLYANNSICSNSVLHAAMIYHTQNRDCEALFTEAQTPMFELCGTQNGIPCMGQCTEQFQIDTPRRPCDVYNESSPMTRYVTMAGIFITSVLILWIPESEYDVESPKSEQITEQVKPTTNVTTAVRLESIF